MSVGMSDLIDWKSPEIKIAHSAKLASPLIPAPNETENGNLNTCNNALISLNNGKRPSLDNNPFDKVLIETTEYVRKKDDPFEAVLEKALNSKTKKSVPLRTLSANSPKDTPKRKRRADTLKLNKTLDDSLFIKKHAVLNYKKELSANEADKSIIEDLNNTNLLSDDAKQDCVKDGYSQCNYVIEVNSSFNLSILNQSAMNDTLSEGSHISEECVLKSALCENKSLCTMKVTTNNENSLSSNYLRLPKLRRSLSQGEKFSPKKHANWRTQSTIESSKHQQESVVDGTIESLPSVFFDDSLNKAFLDSKLSNNSVFSSMSDISAIRKLSSVSSMGCHSTGSMVSDGTMNRAFVNSCLSTISNSREENKSGKGLSIQRSLSASSAPVALPIRNENEISDLTDKFNRLKTKSLDYSRRENSVHEKLDNLSNSSSKIDKVETTPATKRDGETEKLIDVEIFVPDKLPNKEQHINSISESSMDSVFSEESKGHQSILQEAILLAKTFEEMAVKSDKSSGASSTEDLLINNSQWMSELLPAFEDEELTENLIELPLSPSVNGNTEKRIVENTNVTGQDNIKGQQDIIKDFETDLVSTIPADKKTAAATLLLDLERLVQEENNSEAIQLLEQLEKVLGINCKNNTELLATCLNTANHLIKSPKKPNSELNDSNNVQDNHLDTSNKDGNLCKANTMNEDLSEHIENKLDVATSVTTCASTDDLPCNGQHMPEFLEQIVENSSANELKAVPTQNDKADDNDVKDIECKSNSNDETEGIKAINDNAENTVNDSRSDEKLAMELLINLGKILNKESVESAPMDALKNLGKVLNFAINNSNLENTQATHVQKKITKPSSPQNKSFHQRRPSLSSLPRSSHRQSLDLSKLKRPERTTRRSIAVTRTTPNKAIPSSPISSKDKSKSHLTETKKRFSSDPGCINSLGNNKKPNSITEVKRKPELVKDIPLKSISLLDVNKEKSSGVMDNVKNKLKKKIESDVVIKKGPMKALIPLGNMQKLETTDGKVSSSTDAVTPPKNGQNIPRFTVTSSTPNSLHNRSVHKKSPRTKPMASSTPDSGLSKTHATKIQSSQELKKGNVSCDISPVSAQADNDSNILKESPKRVIKSPSIRKATPVKYQRADTIEFNRPKYYTSPRLMKRNSSQGEVQQFKKYSETNQVPTWKLHDSKNTSPLKKGKTLPQQSPLKDSNKLPIKVRPFKLISKLQCGGGNNIMEKENNYV